MHVVPPPGLIPWPLLHFDKTLSVLQAQYEPFQLLSSMSSDIETWFLSYLQQDLQKGSTSMPWGLSYRNLSRFAHDLGFVPKLLKEPELYSLHEEILRWADSDPGVLWRSLPQELTGLDLAQAEMSLRADRGAQEAGADRGILGLLTFSLLLATIATQVFTDQHSDSIVANNNNHASHAPINIKCFPISIATCIQQVFPSGPAEGRLAKLLEWLEAENPPEEDD